MDMSRLTDTRRQKGLPGLKCMDGVLVCQWRIRLYCRAWLYLNHTIFSKLEPDSVKGREDGTGP